MSLEEEDSIRALAATSEETAELAKTLYAAVLKDSAKLSANKLKLIRLPFGEDVTFGPLVARKAGG